MFNDQNVGADQALASPAGPERLLVVEDDVTLADALKAGLSSAYHVVAVQDAPSALHVIAQQRFDLVLLDLILPRGTGLEVLAALHSLGPDVPPALVMSALGSEVDLSQFQSVLAGQLEKPFGLAELKGRVRDALAGRRQSTLSVQACSVSILLVDDDEEFREGTAGFLRRSGYTVRAVSTAGEAMLRLRQERYDAVVTDWIMPGTTGLQLVQQIREVAPRVPVLLLTGYATPELTRRAIAAGAVDVLVKPFPPRALPVALEKTLHQHRNQPVSEVPGVPLAKPAQRVATGGTVRYSLADIIGESPVMQRTKQTLVRAAALDSVVLIQGETGTGKELFAQALHYVSGRSRGPFVAVNAAAIPENLLESELFGYASGAFTGARKEGHKGRFLLADGGTLFLDEIGDLPQALQVKLLRVLQEGQVDLVGGNARQVDVRVVVATHRDLETMVAEGRFRSDLYYRLNVVTLHLPPLRDRSGDIPVLAARFLQELAERYSRPHTRFDPECFPVLQAYHWPGNVRELRNVVERAFAFCAGDLILPSDLPDCLQGRRKAPGSERSRPPAGQPQDLASHEREVILRALEATNGNKLQAAKLLGISRAGLYVKLKIYGIG